MGVAAGAVALLGDGFPGAVIPGLTGALAEPGFTVGATTLPPPDPGFPPAKGAGFAAGVAVLTAGLPVGLAPAAPGFFSGPFLSGGFDGFPDLLGAAAFAAGFAADFDFAGAGFFDGLGLLLFATACPLCPSKCAEAAPPPARSEYSPYRRRGRGGEYTDNERGRQKEITGCRGILRVLR